MKKVVIIQRGISNHRIPFYEGLKRNLEAKNIHLYLIQGHFDKDNDKNSHFSTILWASVIKNRVIRMFGKELYWQPISRYFLGSNLIIVEQANGLLLNYFLFALKRLYKFRLALWGHGKNFQSLKSDSLSEQIKRIYSNKVDWWFAYTNLSAKIVMSFGYPTNKITTVQNAIDTRRLVSAKNRITKLKLDNIKNELGLKSDNVCIYIGGMYHKKRLEFLIKACFHIKKKVSDFEMIFIGDGQEDYKIKQVSERYKWVHYVGPKFDEEKVPYFMLSKLILMPGLVGLAILDAFALETPLITTDIPYHSPEIDYLVDGVNGVIVRELNDPSVFADRASYLLKNNKAREKLIVGCRIAREKYTIEKMVERFAVGVIRALES